LNTYPDREGIETPLNGRKCFEAWLNTYPDREGIETFFVVVCLLYPMG